MFLNLTKLILSFFDLLDRKKILSYFKRNIKHQLKCFIDVGLIGDLVFCKFLRLKKFYVQVRKF